MFGWFSPVFTQLTKLRFLDFELTNSETALGCFQVMSYVNLVAIGIILDKSWVSQQCAVTSLQTHRRFSGTFVLTFPKTHASLLPLTFPFLSPKPTTHQQLNWSRALCWSAPSARDIHSSVHRFLFPVRPKVSPSICWILFWYFLFFPCSFIFCVVFTETLAHLVVNACLFMPLFFLYSSIASMLLFLFLFFDFRGFSVLFLCYSHSIMNNVCFALLLAWGKKNYLYWNSTKTPSQILWGLDLVFFNHHFLRKLITLSCWGSPALLIFEQCKQCLLCSKEILVLLTMSALLIF